MKNKSDELLLEKLRELQWEICALVRESVLTKSSEELSAVAREGDDDTIYAIDAETEGLIEAFFEKKIKPDISCVLVAEGLEEGGVAFTPSGRAADAEWTVLMDPIDGTRGLMYGKRSAWTLAGAARGAGPGLTLKDIVLAAQTEIPPPKQTMADQLYAEKGGGARGLRRNVGSTPRTSLGVAPAGINENEFIPKPSRAKELHYGFVSFSRFFPGTKDIITEIELELNRRLEAAGEKYFYFEDQYICTGGQLAEILTGRDRFVCDLRGAAAPLYLKRTGKPLLCMHPYDICTELIAREAGVFVTNEKGGPISAPLDTTSDVTWIAYANEHIKNIMESDLLNIIAAACKIT